MISQMASIIALLENRRKAIDRALVALREIDDDVPEWVRGSSSVSASARAKVPKKRSAAARKRMAEAQRKRWERIRSGS